jgi:hypothetical protein
MFRQSSMPKRGDIARYYVIVRTDLAIATQMVQVAHACITAGNRFPLAAHHHLVFLGVASEPVLQDTASSLARDGVDHALFFEPDENVGYTALCTGPVIGENQRLFRRFRLWRH